MNQCTRALWVISISGSLVSLSVQIGQVCDKKKRSSAYKDNKTVAVNTRQICESDIKSFY